MNVYLAGKHCNTSFLVVVLLIYYVDQAKFDSIDGRKGEPECLCSMGSEVDHGSV